MCVKVVEFKLGKSLSTEGVTKTLTRYLNVDHYLVILSSTSLAKNYHEQQKKSIDSPTLKLQQITQQNFQFKRRINKTT